MSGEPTPEPIATLEELLQRAADARAGKRWLEAARLYETYLNQHPEDGDTWCWRGFSLWQAGDLEGAIEGYSRAAQYEPTWAGIHNCLGTLNRQLERYDLAAAEYRTALKLSPRFGEAHVNLATLLKTQGQYGEALHHLRQAVEANPDSADLHQDLAMALMELGQYAQAHMAIREACRLQPERTGYQITLATLRSRQGRHDDALQLLRGLITTQPEPAWLYSRLAWACFEAERYDEAEQAARDALSRDPRLPYPIYLLGWLAQRRDEHDAAISYFKRYLEVDPADAEGAGLALARLGAAPVPDRAPDPYMRQLYASRAAFWDGNMTSKVRYRAPVQVADALADAMGGRQGLDIMDMGCGTGIGGLFLRERARWLTGLDMSAHMLEKAREKAVYDELILGDLLKELPARPERYDAVASAATLLHFGDLSEPLKAVAATLRPGGYAAFTCFPARKGDALEVLPYNCHAHSPDHIRLSAQAAGFQRILIEEHIHEYHQDTPQPGLVVLLRKAGGEAG